MIQVTFPMHHEMFMVPFVIPVLSDISIVYSLFLCYTAVWDIVVWKSHCLKKLKKRERFEGNGVCFVFYICNSILQAVSGENEEV